MTKNLFIETRRKFKDSDVNLNILNDLPGKNIALAATIQYIDLIPKVKEYLESLGKSASVKQGAYYEGHILGCNSSALNSESDTNLVITDGKFHAINNAIQLQEQIYVFNGKSLSKVEKKEIEDHNKKTQIKQKKFLAAKRVGLLVTSKHGQHQNAIHKIKEKIKSKNKDVYVFESDNINAAEFENFPQIQIWVNTACFGLARDDMRIINLSDILEFI